jgi:hypothetical protein
MYHTNGISGTLHTIHLDCLPPQGHVLVKKTLCMRDTDAGAAVDDASAVANERQEAWVHRRQWCNERQHNTQEPSVSVLGVALIKTSKIFF